ncbi:MAG: CinA family protein [Peptococcaceae bacterium]|nr:CinA family protein [Peptococcaceae bacterium]
MYTLTEEAGLLLRKKELKLSVAESCTGGLISAKITDIPGSSVYFIGGVVAYSNKIKNALLSVPWEELDKYGAVSSEVALSMAKGVKELMQTDLALGITGIAGPVSDCSKKPVGLVYIAISGPCGNLVDEFNFRGSRIEVREKSLISSLEMVVTYLQNLFVSKK